MNLLDKLYKKVKEVVDSGNKDGIPFPLVRDPKKGRGSVSLTLVFLSFNLAFFGTIGKFTNLVGDVDLTNALWLFGVCASLYWGRHVKKNADGSVEMSGVKVSEDGVSKAD